MSAVPEVSEAAVEAACLAQHGEDAWEHLPRFVKERWKASMRPVLAAAAPEIARAAKVEALSDAMDVASGPAGTPEAIYKGIAALYLEATE